MRKAATGSKLEPIDKEINRIIAQVGAWKGRASLPHHQAPVRSYEHPLSGGGKEPSVSVHAVRARLPVHRERGAGGMTRTQLKLDRTAVPLSRGDKNAKKWPFDGTPHFQAAAKGQSH